MKEVEDAGLLGDRGVDPASFGVWVQLATSLLGAAGAAVPVVQKIIEMIRGKGIKGVKVTVPAGTISVDEISAKDLEKLLKAVNQPSGSHPAQP